jgi:hypothetical protein
MNNRIKAIVDEIDELMEAANPKNGSAPLGPIVQLGNLINNKWPTIRAALIRVSGEEAR